MKKSVRTIIPASAILLALALFLSPLAASAEAPAETAPVVSLTIEELAQYNGKDGMPAYVAISGKVYDVTDVPQWQGGMHQGQYEAGQDLTDIITGAPHGESVLESLPVVAYLLTGEDMDIPAQTLTVSDLAANNGKDGNPAYIAVDGIVYDVSSSAMWQDGVHEGQFEAGQDFSEAIRDTSPHGISVLEGMPVVARLVFDPVEEVAE